MSHSCCGKTGKILQALCIFEHTVSTTAASVTVTEHTESSLLNVFSIAVVRGVVNMFNIIIALIMGGLIVRKNFASVGTAPFKKVVRESVCIIIEKFGGNKILHTALFNNLRQGV